MAALRINPERAWQQAFHILSLLRDHWPERAPPLLLSLRPRPPPANLTLNVDFLEPRYQPVLEITAEDLAPFSPRDWGAFLASLTTASPSPSSAEKTASASPSARPFPVEVGRVIALAGAAVLFAALAIWYRRMRRRALRGGGGGSRGGGGWGRRRLGGRPSGLISLLPGCAGARLTRHASEDEGSLARAAEDHGAAWLARLAGTGTLDLEMLRRVVLQALHLPLPGPQESCISSFRAICVGIGVQHQASVPEWNAPSMEEADDYRATTLQKMGSVVCPPNMDISAAHEIGKTRKERVDNCSCSRPGSVNCVRAHIRKARVWIKDQLGEVAFRNCGLDAMGKHVEELWTAADKKKLEDGAKLIDDANNEHRPQ
ncbi:unnamed protein product [Alopecurus aequalis]